MKSLSFLLMLLLINLVFITETSFSKSFEKKDFPKIQKLGEIAPNLYQSGNLFFSGQPNLETFEWLKTQEVDLIINLRSEKENDEFAKSAFNEKERAAILGMKYISIPVLGNDSYTKENLIKFGDALNSRYNKVFIHCASCGRVSNFMIAYLVQYQNYEMNEAIDFGKQLRFSFPLENLLDKKIIWKTD
ncbi:fused DSP-PTPase phosphatase/NAD kinase-like protein [Maribellus maritimus]|uniref:fused DSP-PTPase phosphatase/NAD kinase-like protein n=1 Tax=Maribellus maritimus TaxID=2870838 RepID=UPI001EEADC79|nr:dual specificity protein phosphatase family protein [Maribellus maritimus]MCG6188932.1 dual specificity protein phosphatase family protein [Maribellus maritimus]